MAHISICIPTWQGAAFIGETLASVAVQTHRDFSVLISVDGGDERTAAACAGHLTDSRFRIVVQDRRLGWVRNTNASLGMAAGDYTAILPHDDLLLPDYLAALLQFATEHPEAACVYCDIEAFGNFAPRVLTAPSLCGNTLNRILAFLISQFNLAPRVMTAPSLCGNVLTRLMAFISSQFNAVAFRGLVRQGALARAVGIPSNEADDFAGDTVWVARLVAAGEVLRLPRILYRKRYHSGNTHNGWSGWDRGRQAWAWQVHCRQLLEVAFETVMKPEARYLLLLAASARLVQACEITSPFKSIRARSVEEKCADIRSLVAAKMEEPDLAMMGFPSAEAAGNHIAHAVVGVKATQRRFSV